MHNFVKRNDAIQQSSQDGRRQIAHGLKMPTNSSLSVVRTGSPRPSMPPPARPDSANRGQVAERKPGPFSESSYPSSTTGSVSEIGAGPRANSRQPRAGGRPEGHVYGEYDYGLPQEHPYSEDAEVSDGDEGENQGGTRDALHAMDEHPQKGRPTYFVNNTNAYESDSDMQNGDETLHVHNKLSMEEAEPDYAVRYARATLAASDKAAGIHKRNLNLNYHANAAERQQQIGRYGPESPQLVAEQEQYVGQPSYGQQQHAGQQQIDTHNNLLNNQQTLYRAPELSNNNQLSEHQTLHESYEPERSLPVTTADTSSHKPVATKVAIRGHQEERPLSSAPQKRRAQDLDYPEDQLRGADFAELMTQSFDHDPAASSRVADGLDKLPLPQRLTHMLHRSSQEQESFLTLLPLQQWQEAGQWFGNQFAQLNERLVQSRQKRREIAKKYEADIERRYKDVTKERAVYDNALQGMGLSGKNVIAEGTPHRKKK